MLGMDIFRVIRVFSALRCLPVCIVVDGPLVPASIKICTKSLPKSALCVSYPPRRACPNSSNLIRYQTTMSTLKDWVRAINEQEATSRNIRDLARSLAPAAFYASDYPATAVSLVGTFWAAGNDKAELQKLGLDIDNLFWRWYDI
jgi:hypothetical protein